MLFRYVNFENAFLDPQTYKGISFRSSGRAKGGARGGLLPRTPLILKEEEEKKREKIRRIRSGDGEERRTQPPPSLDFDLCLHRCLDPSTLKMHFSRFNFF